MKAPSMKTVAIRSALLATQATVCTIAVFDNQGSPIGEIEVALPALSFVQIEKILADGLGFVGEAWAEISSQDAGASFFAHASVVDGSTGDPTYISATVVTRVTK